MCSHQPCVVLWASACDDGVERRARTRGNSSEVTQTFLSRPRRQVSWGCSRLTCIGALTFESRDSARKSFTCQKEHRPRLILIHFPCTYWTQTQRLNARATKHKHRLAQRQSQDLIFIESTVAMAMQQMRAGDDFIIENLVASAALKTQAITDLFTSSEVLQAVGGTCRYGLRHSQHGWWEILQRSRKRLAGGATVSGDMYPVWEVEWRRLPPDTCRCWGKQHCRWTQAPAPGGRSAPHLGALSSPRTTGSAFGTPR